MNISVTKLMFLLAITTQEVKNFMMLLCFKVEVRYLSLEKAILVVVHATRKLPHYFQAHTMVVLTQLPLKSILRSADYTGRVAEWGTILGAFDIKYMPRTSIKGQVLADLVAEFAECPKEMNMEKHGIDEKSVGIISIQCSTHWEVYVDGAANQRGSAVRSEEHTSELQSRP